MTRRARLIDEISPIPTTDKRLRNFGRSLWAISNGQRPQSVALSIAHQINEEFVLAASDLIQFPQLLLWTTMCSVGVAGCARVDHSEGKVDLFVPLDLTQRTEGLLAVFSIRSICVRFAQNSSSAYSMSATLLVEETKSQSAHFSIPKVQGCESIIGLEHWVDSIRRLEILHMCSTTFQVTAGRRCKFVPVVAPRSRLAMRVSGSWDSWQPPWKFASVSFNLSRDQEAS